MAIFGPKPWVNSIGKISVFRLLELYVFIAQKGFFRSRIQLKIFSWAILHKKEKLEKWPFLDYLEKCQFFYFLNFMFLQPRKTFFRSRISLNTFFWPILPKKKVRKRPFLDQNDELTPLEKIQFFDFLNFLFLLLRKEFFRSRISLKTISRHILSKKRQLETWPFLDQNHGSTPLEKCKFFDFLNVLFLQLRKACFGSRISLKTFSWPILIKKKSWINGHFLT